MDFTEYLSTQQRLPLRDVERIRQLHAESGERVATLLLRLGLIGESELAAAFAEYLQLPRYAAVTAPTAAPVDGLSSRFLSERLVVPLIEQGAEPVLLMADPSDDYAAAAMAFVYAKPLSRVVAQRGEVEALIDQLYADTAQAAATDSAAIEYDIGTSSDDIERLRDLASEAPVIRLVQRLITQAIERKASDIHIEPMDNGLIVRLRIDGVLHELERLPESLRLPLVSRIKIMAQLNIAERRLPQDGRMRLTLMGHETDFRVASSPTLHGESVVLRILDRRDVALEFAALGFAAEASDTLHRALAQPHGVVLVTGPTGSGKTTTLYAALRELNSTQRKILTAEDPIEYALAGVNQVQIKPQIGLDFANVLRAFLRQDPDVLLVGEIRDHETARIAIQAALTGHLLLSTLHTNSAAGAIPRLLDMGIEDYLLSSTLSVIVGQRLARRLCIDCRRPYTASESLHARLAREFATVPEGSAAALYYRAEGCPACGGSGYVGRIVIAEVMEVGPAVQAQILQRSDATRIESAAVDSGMRSLWHDGLAKARAGLTSIEEVLRVVRAA